MSSRFVMFKVGAGKRSPIEKLEDQSVLLWNWSGSRLVCRREQHATPGRGCGASIPQKRPYAHRLNRTATAEAVKGAALV